MDNINCTVMAPVDSYSGFGTRVRGFVKQLIKQYSNWNIQIISCSWGVTSMGYLKDNNEQDIINHLCKTSDKDEIDIWIQCTIPEEFYKNGKVNIGLTTIAHPWVSDKDAWVNGCNQMDMIIVSSEHSANQLKSLNISTPISVLFEGYNSSVYGLPPKTDILKNVNTTWNYLCVGNWYVGDNAPVDSNRKNIDDVVSIFLNTFKDIDNAPGLILKTNGVSTSENDKYNIIKQINYIKSQITFTKSLPEIYLIHGDLLETEMNDLYMNDKVKAMINLSSNDDWSGCLLEFATSAKPIITTNWSGIVEILNINDSFIVGGNVRKCGIFEFINSNNIAFKLGLYDVWMHYDEWLNKSKNYLNVISTQYRDVDMGEKLKDIL